MKKHLLPRGFTLVELLVVIAIIGVLIALLLPAVQAAREAARRMQCTNHIKQIGLGVHNFHDTRNGLPPVGLGSFGGDNSRRASFWVLILPYMEQTPLYDEACKTGSYGSTSYVNAGATAETCTAGTHDGIHANFSNAWFHSIGDTNRKSFSSVPVYKCPTRRSGSAMSYIKAGADDTSNNAERDGPLGDYAVVLCSQAGGTGWWGELWHPTNHVTNMKGPIRFASITNWDFSTWKPRDTMAAWQDGTSNQIVVGEKHIPLGKVGTAPDKGSDCNMFAYGNGWQAAGAARPIAFSYDGTANAYRVAPLRRAADFKESGTQIIFADGDKGAGFGSWHSGVCHFLLGDGSVRSVSVTVSTDVLQAVALIDDGKTVSF